MSILYIAFAPLFFLTLYRRFIRLVAAVRIKDSSRIKLELLFLGLVLTVSFFVFTRMQAVSS